MPPSSAYEPISALRPPRLARLAANRRLPPAAASRLHLRPLLLRVPLPHIRTARPLCPIGRTAPRPGAAAKTFTFGRLPEQGGAAPPAAPADRNRSNFDPEPEQLRWWQQPRNAVTVSGSSNKDIEAWWGSAGGAAVEELVNAGARTANSELQCTWVAVTLMPPAPCDPQCTSSHACCRGAGAGQLHQGEPGGPRGVPSGAGETILPLDAPECDRLRLLLGVPGPRWCMPPPSSRARADIPLACVAGYPSHPSGCCLGF